MEGELFLSQKSRFGEEGRRRVVEMGVHKHMSEVLVRPTR